MERIEFVPDVRDESKHEDNVKSKGGRDRAPSLIAGENATTIEVLSRVSGYDVVV